MGFGVVLAHACCGLNEHWLFDCQTGVAVPERILLSAVGPILGMEH